ncbi:MULTISPECIES: hypothetical protein [unclassified Bradyrhizobium]|uniref:hypothetical protein n=1 Tax=unclassified Bradyrhizobium TaxID=2631580 RepID=UPI002916BE43|nr:MULTISPECIES: hypothetical protein [unclassified Bradyrhizobium]
MTRILFWNIENFSVNKIFSASIKRQRGHGGLNDMQSAIQRRAVINAVLAAVQPDIIVIIEVSSGDNAPNALASQTGGINALAMVQFGLNNPATMVAGGWNAVPPLYTGVGGRSETVGILYRRTNTAGTLNRYFTGPNIWTGGHGGVSVPPGGGVATPYNGMVVPLGAVNVNGMLVPPGLGGVRQIPAGAQHNGGLNEDVVAARIAFTTTLGAPVAFAGLREPFMATFTEANNLGVVQRDLTIFGIHSPPNNPAAANYITTLSTINDVVGALGVNETRVIGGDFNVNLFAVNGTASGLYNPLTGGPGAYTLLVSPTAVGVPVNLDQYKGYFSTHIRGKDKTAASKFLWSNGGGPGQSFYPGYGYVGSNFVAAPFYSIDNVLVWPHNGMHNYQTTIMNTVTGTPMNAVMAPPDNPPPGAIALANQFTAPPMGWPGAPTAANYPGIGGAGNLTGWSNYGRVRNTSDHFGISADI